MEVVVAFLTYLFGKPNKIWQFFPSKSLYFLSKNCHNGPKFADTNLTLSILQFEQLWA